VATAGKHWHLSDSLMFLGVDAFVSCLLGTRVGGQLLPTDVASSMHTAVGVRGWDSRENKWRWGRRYAWGAGIEVDTELDGGKSRCVGSVRVGWSAKQGIRWLCRLFAYWFALRLLTAGDEDGSGRRGSPCWW
jgi:hypothetical protein